MLFIARLFIVILFIPVPPKPADSKLECSLNVVERKQLDEQELKLRPAGAKMQLYLQYGSGLLNVRLRILGPTKSWQL